MKGKKFDYAFLFLSYLKGKEGKFCDIKEVAAKFNLPPAYLEKVAQELKRGGWVESRRGAGGGYRLIKNPQTVTIESLINFYEPIYSFCPVLRDLKNIGIK